MVQSACLVANNSRTNMPCTTTNEMFTLMEAPFHAMFVVNNAKTRCVFRDILNCVLQNKRTPTSYVFGYTEGANERYCKVCDKTFHSRTYFTSHFRNVHERKQVLSKVECRSCGKTMVNSSYFGRHQSVCAKKESQRKTQREEKVEKWKALEKKNVERNKSLQNQMNNIVTSAPILKTKKTRQKNVANKCRIEATSKEELAQMLGLPFSVYEKLSFEELENEIKQSEKEIVKDPTKKMESKKNKPISAKVDLAQSSNADIEDMKSLIKDCEDDEEDVKSLIQFETKDKTVMFAETEHIKNVYEMAASENDVSLKNEVFQNHIIKTFAETCFVAKTSEIENNLFHPSEVKESKLNKSDENEYDESKNLDDSTKDQREHEADKHKVYQNESYNLKHTKVTQLSSLDCTICHKTFSHKRKKTYHMWMWHTTGQFLCIKCGQPFERRGDMKNHIRSRHNEKKSPSKSATTSNALPRIAGDKLCIECGKRFKTSRYLRSHMRVHSKEIFECNICLKQFRASKNLKHHITTVHSTQNVMFSCSKCVKVFKYEALLATHTRNVHDIKAHDCSTCGKTCKNWAALKKHKLNNHRQHKTKVK